MTCHTLPVKGAACCTTCAAGEEKYVAEAAETCQEARFASLSSSFYLGLSLSLSLSLFVFLSRSAYTS